MYGVFCTTPPHRPAATVASASVSRMSRARNWSPAAAADSVLSMPPMTVARAKGTARARYGAIRSSVSTHASVGQGGAIRKPVMASAMSVGAAPPRRARPQYTRAPASTAAKAPGRPPGRRTRPISVTSTRVSDTRPTRGSPNTLRAGRNAMRSVATPAMEPSRAARGTTRRAQSPVKASASLSAPIVIVTPMPIFHARTASPVRSLAGPSTPNTMPKSVGVSIPNGIAVTSSRPRRRMSEIANHV
jgi:hypothetical protein